MTLDELLKEVNRKPDEQEKETSRDFEALRALIEAGGTTSSPPDRGMNKWTHKLGELGLGYAMYMRHGDEDMIAEARRKLLNHALDLPPGMNEVVTKIVEFGKEIINDPNRP